MALRCRVSLDGDLGAQIGFGLLGVGELVAQLAAFEFALGEHLHLLGEPAFELLHAAAEDFGFGGLRDQRAFELADAVAKLLDLAALVVELGGRVAGVLALAVEPVADLAGFLLVFVDAVLERIDLGAQRHDLDALAVGMDRALVEIGC